MKERRMNEKTKVSITIATFIIMILFIITSTTATITWINEVDYKIQYNKEQNILQDEDRKQLSQKEIELRSLFIEIKTDLKWIKEKLQEEY